MFAPAKLTKLTKLTKPRRSFCAPCCPGLDVVTKHLSTKLAYFLLERGDKFKNPQKIKRKVVRTGDKKNNFFIDFAGK